MKRQLAVLSALCVLTASIVFADSPKPQTRPWRVGVVGGFSTGYLGIFALHGFPRERLMDTDLLDLQKLKQYDMIICGWRGSASGQAMQTLEQYVREGGILFTELVPPPSPEAIPGQRIGPLPAPNMRFVDSGTAVTAGLPELGVMHVTGQNGVSIIPPAGSDTVVLARFTDDETARRAQGNFTLPDGQGAPAIIMANVGKGKYIYSGGSISYAMSLRGREFEPFLVNLMRYVSNGEVDDRMYPGDVQRTDLASLPQTTVEETPYPAPAGTPAALPAGYEALEEATSLRDFALTGGLTAGTEASVLISYWAPDNFRELVIKGGQVSLLRHGKSGAAVLETRPLPKDARDVVIMRRYGLVTVKTGQQLVLSACDGPLTQGALGVRGLHEPSYQPLDRVSFDDDFMRDTAATDEWEPVAGKWVVQAAEGKPDMGANPFDYVASSPAEAVSITGQWFWSDYAYDAATKIVGTAAGIIANYQGPDDYFLLRLTPGTPGKLQLLRKSTSGFKLLAETSVMAKASDWHKLGLRTSHGLIMGLLDGEARLQTAVTDYPCGQIGLYLQGGDAHFDDVVVRPWIATEPRQVPQARNLMAVTGQWQNNTAGSALTGTGVNGARALATWNGGADCTASVEVNPGQAAAAGLHLRYLGPDKYYLLALLPDAKGLKLRFYRQGTPNQVLAEKTVPGKSNAWHTLSAVMRGNRVLASVDGKQLLDVLDTGHTTGLIGLYMRGAKPASFRNFTGYELAPDEQIVDEPTPQFAGIIDRHTWAGRCGAWNPDSADLNTFWHLGYLPGDMQTQIGVHPGSATRTVTRLYLSPDRQKTQGYTLVATCEWKTGTVSVALSRLGQQVARQEVKVPPGKAYELGLQRRGSQLLAEVAFKPVLLYSDKQPLANLTSLGMENEGSLIYADDTAVSSTQVADYTFEKAPTDWTIESGTWDLTSRWSCTPGWSWFTGYDLNGAANIVTKHAFAGDQEITMYVGAKMIALAGGRNMEKLTDIDLGMMVGDKTGETGYWLILGGGNNTYSALRRNGVQVVTSPLLLPQNSIHNDWMRITLRKRGSKITAYVWDTKVLEYDDPEPLNSGRVSIGTFQNGILVPRVTIFGQQVPLAQSSK